MSPNNYSWLITVILLSLITMPNLIMAMASTKSKVFMSPKFEVEPGSVINQYYYDIDFPRGHIGIKSFEAEAVDESGKPVPLFDLYLHHWIVFPYRTSLDYNSTRLNETSRCLGTGLNYYFGVGSETRRTPTRLPSGPQVIETGKFDDERWVLNVHAIDTRGVEDRFGCTECRCDLYNVTVDEYGRDLSPDYKGGLLCYYDNTRCRLREGFNGGGGINKRGLFMKFTVTWLDWSESLLPVRIFTLDVTDDYYGNVVNGTRRHSCHVEYDVEKSCNASNRCDDVKRAKVGVPRGGEVVYIVSHQHTAGRGGALYGEDGKLLCKSNPVYGEGNVAGNEAGYVVGMSTCYPKPGTVKIRDGETLVFESNYDSTEAHTGVMGLVNIAVLDRLPYSSAVSPL